MRIFRPAEIHLMRMGLPVTPCNGGGGGSTSSSSNQSTTTQNTDARIANESGVIAQGGSTINYNVQSVDKDVAKAALDFATATNATNGDGFTKLLDTVDRLTTKTADTATTLSSRFQDNVMDAYSRAKADAAGGIDQKTMIVLGVTAAAALVAINMKRKGA